MAISNCRLLGQPALRRREATERRRGVVNDILGELVETDPDRGAGDLVGCASLYQGFRQIARNRLTLLGAHELAARSEAEGRVPDEWLRRLGVGHDHTNEIHTHQVVPDGRRAGKDQNASFVEHSVCSGLPEDSGDQRKRRRADGHQPGKIDRHARGGCERYERLEVPHQAVEPLDPICPGESDTDCTRMRHSRYTS